MAVLGIYFIYLLKRRKSEMLELRSKLMQPFQRPSQQANVLYVWYFQEHVSAAGAENGAERARKWDERERSGSGSLAEREWSG